MMNSTNKTIAAGCASRTADSRGVCAGHGTELER